MQALINSSHRVQSARFKLKPYQRLILAGCSDHSTHSSPMVIRGNGTLPESIAEYKTTAKEADMIVWKHALSCEGQHILIYSPDTDVYLKGLALIHIDPSKDYNVQVNVPHAQDLKYVHLNTLLQALKNDPDLGSLPSDEVALCFQKLYTVSYFSGFGKATFLNDLL